MPYVRDGRLLIRHAYARRYTLAAFNVCSAEMIRACVEAAVAEGAPVLLQTYPTDIEQLPPRQLQALVHSFAEEAPVPVGLHLDHGQSYEMALGALRAGYSSVMFDGADTPLEQVIAATFEIARAAHAQGAAVEVAAESFNVGMALPTRPDEARRLREEGRADMIAVSVGSEHGQRGKLDLELLREIHDAVRGPLVLHGGSGISAEDYAAARELGVVKANIGSALYRALRHTWEHSAGARNHREVYANARTALTDVAREKLQVMGASGQAQDFLQTNFLQAHRAG